MSLNMIDLAKIETSMTREYGVSADQLFRLLSDLPGHHMRVFPRQFSSASYSVVNQGDGAHSYLFAAWIKRNDTIQRAFRCTFDPEMLRCQFATDDGVCSFAYTIEPRGAGSCRLTVSTLNIGHTWRERIFDRWFTRNLGREFGRELHQSLDRYIETLGADVIV